MKIKFKDGVEAWKLDHTDYNTPEFVKEMFKKGRLKYVEEFYCGRSIGEWGIDIPGTIYATAFDGDVLIKLGDNYHIVNGEYVMDFLELF